MFLETNHNRTVYTQQICLPCVLNAVNYCYVQEDIHCPYGRLIHQFIWVEEGALLMTLDDHTCILKAGQGAFIPAHMPHSYIRYGDELPVTAWFSFFGLDGVLTFYEVKSWLLFEVPPAASWTSAATITAIRCSGPWRRILWSMSCFPTCCPIIFPWCIRWIIIWKTTFPAR